MKKTFSLSVLIIIFSIPLILIVGCNNQNPKDQSSVSEESSSGWVKLFEDGNGSVWSYKKGGIDRGADSYTVQRWNKTISDKERNDEIQHRNKKGLSTEGLNQLSNTKSFIEVDCKKRISCLSYLKGYDANGKELYSDYLDKPICGSAVPNSDWDNKIMKIVCK